MSTESAAESGMDDSWDDLIAPLTHELRQEVSAVLHQVELLNSFAVDEATRRRSLGAIEDNAEHLMAFVDDLAALGGLARGRVTATCRPIAVEDLLADSGADRIRRLEWTVPPDESLLVWWVDTDPLIVDQIVALLLVRYERDGVGADAAVSAFPARTKPGCIDVVFTLDPAGPVEPSLFRSATLEDGLGLYLARRMAELVGGDVAVVRSGRRDSYLLRLADAQPATGN